MGGAGPARDGAIIDVRCVHARFACVCGCMCVCAKKSNADLVMGPLTVLSLGLQSLTGVQQKLQ